MKKILFVLLLLCINHCIMIAQKSGKITYERRYYWVNIMSKLSFMTKEDIDREMMAYGKDQGNWKEDYELIFKDDKSLYQQKKTEDNYGYSWKEGSYIITRDYGQKQTKDLIDFLGKDYLVQGPSHKYKWKIQNEIKDIQGYICMKAETTDPVKNTKITAWFTDKIPVSGGPEGLSGLPGMILSVTFNDNDLTIEASSVALSDDMVIPYPKKFKGKEIAIEEFNNKMENYIKETIAGKRNPYWQLRY